VIADKPIQGANSAVEVRREPTFTLLGQHKYLSTILQWARRKLRAENECTIQRRNISCPLFNIRLGIKKMLSTLLTIAVLHWLVLVIPGANVLLVGQLAASGKRSTACVAALGITTVTLT
jgi:hypothetical protein